MGDHRLGSILRLVGDALRLEAEFGTHSIEMLAWIASTVEASVYLPSSMVRTPSGFRFSLANPPLRIGAFSALRVGVDGSTVPADQVRLRAGPGTPWRGSGELSPAHPLELEAGTRTEIDVQWPGVDGHRSVQVRLELQSVAIPPLVWLEIRDTPREEPSE